ncbi:hypothetical protein C8J57DRAFT_1221099 [Mycena rebaudengoi]|nr:hypothetical protein C8J57DRAFT_1221099 [Mycena rebaudengoi]
MFAGDGTDGVLTSVSAKYSDIFENISIAMGSHPMYHSNADSLQFELGKLGIQKASRCSRCGHFSASQTNPSVAPHPRDRLPGVLSEIDALSAHLERLYAERDAIQAELDSIVYPVLTLPPEITSDIFVWCLPEHTGPISRHSAPLCFWPKFVAAGGRLRSTSRGSGAASSYGWIPPVALTSMRPIEVRSAEYDEEKHEEYCASLDLIHDDLLHAHHWEDMSFALGFRDYERLFGDPGTAFPMLRRLELDNTTEEPELPPYPLDCFPALGNCPALRDISVSAEFLVSFPRHFPWAGITRFEPSYFRQDGWKVLRAAVNLEECVLHSFHDVAPDASLFPPHVQLTSLKRLELVRGGLLECLTLPAIQKLRFQISNQDSPIFLSFQTRSSCNITRLSVRLDLRAHNFAQLLSSVPHLVEFFIPAYIDGTGIFPRWLNSLSKRGTDHGSTITFSVTCWRRENRLMEALVPG